jgi:hypothetical protein
VLRFGQSASHWTHSVPWQPTIPAHKHQIEGEDEYGLSEGGDRVQLTTLHSNIMGWIYAGELWGPHNPAHFLDLPLPRKRTKGTAPPLSLRRWVGDSKLGSRRSGTIARGWECAQDAWYTIDGGPRSYMGRSVVYEPVTGSCVASFPPPSRRPEP